MSTTLDSDHQCLLGDHGLHTESVEVVLSRALRSQHCLVHHRLWALLQSSDRHLHHQSSHRLHLLNYHIPLLNPVVNHQLRQCRLLRLLSRAQQVCLQTVLLLLLLVLLLRLRALLLPLASLPNPRRHQFLAHCHNKHQHLLNNSICLQLSVVHQMLHMSSSSS